MPPGAVPKGEEQISPHWDESCLLPGSTEMSPGVTETPVSARTWNSHYWMAITRMEDTVPWLRWEQSELWGKKWSKTGSPSSTSKRCVLPHQEKLQQQAETWTSVPFARRIPFMCTMLLRLLSTHLSTPEHRTSKQVTATHCICRALPHYQGCFSTHSSSPYPQKTSFCPLSQRHP